MALCLLVSEAAVRVFCIAATVSGARIAAARPASLGRNHVQCRYGMKRQMPQPLLDAATVPGLLT